MKVKEIRELLNRISEVHGEKYDDWNLTVITNDPSMGALSQVQVKSVSLGFDWNRGNLMIQTTTPIIKKKDKE